MVLTRTGGVLCMLLLMTGCAQGPEDARQELTSYRIPWDQTFFLEYAELDSPFIIRLFLQGGMDPNVTDERGETALMKAARKGHTEVVEALLKGGANPLLKANLTDETALSLARENGHAEVVRLLESAQEGPPRANE